MRPKSSSSRPSSSRPGTAIKIKDDSGRGGKRGQNGGRRGSVGERLDEDDDEVGVYQDMSASRPVSRGEVGMLNDGRPVSRGSTVRFMQGFEGDRRPESRGSQAFETYAPGVGSTIITLTGQVVSCFAIPGDQEHAVYIGETQRIRRGQEADESETFDHPQGIGDLQGGDVTTLQPHGLGMVLYSTDDPKTRTRFRGTFDKGAMTGLGVMEWQDGAKVRFGGFRV